MEIITGNLLDMKGVLCQQVNCQGVMGAGLAAQIAGKWPGIRREYRQYISTMRGHKARVLGTVHFYEAEEGVVIANLFGQDQYGTDRQYTEYWALEKALGEAYSEASCWGMELYIPMGIGCGLGGGKWPEVIEIIERAAPEAVIVRLPRMKVTPSRRKALAEITQLMQEEGFYE